jgi:hypothetical protein
MTQDHFLHLAGQNALSALRLPALNDFAGAQAQCASPMSLADNRREGKRQSLTFPGTSSLLEAPQGNRILENL